MNFEVVLPDHLVLEGEARKSVCEQLFYLDERIDDARFDDRNRLWITVKSNADLTSNEITELTNSTISLCEKTAESFRRVENPILFEQEGSGIGSRDPHEELISTRQFIPLGTGIAAYSGFLFRLLKGLDSSFKSYALETGAVEQEYPTTLRVRSLAENGYLSSFPQHAIFAAAVHPSFEGLDEIIRKSKEPVVSEQLEIEKRTLELPRQILAPTVCHHCFESLRDVTIGSDSPLYFTAVGRCHRHEYKTTSGLERLQTFTMRELIFYGTEQQVVARRDQIFEFTKKLLSSWKVKFRVIGANDPFFAIDAGNKRSFQSILGLKQELQFYLPYNQKWLAVGSVNNHRDSLTKSYKIQTDSNIAHSGCVAFGIERMALGILAQFGTDSNKWPSELQALVK